MINRSALLLRYKEPAIRWINETDPERGGHKFTIEEVNRERTVYLISEEISETPDDLREWVEVNFEVLFERELESWYIHPNLWPRQLSLRLFDRWFSVECHTVVIDTAGRVIEDDET